MTATRSLAVLAFVVTLLLPGCAHEITGTAITAAGAGPDTTSGDSQCATVTAPLADIPPTNTGEPQLRIPVPTGWRRNTTLDNEVIRYAILAPHLTADAFTPSAIVTLESVPSAADPNLLFDENRKNLANLAGAEDLTTTTNSTCGLPSETTDYTAPELGPAPVRTAVMHAVVAGTDDATYLTTLTIQTADASDPDYVREAGEIVDGFQMLAPAS